MNQFKEVSLLEYHLALFPLLLLAILSGNLGPILQMGNNTQCSWLEHSTPYSRCIHQTGMGVEGR